MVNTSSMRGRQQAVTARTLCPCRALAENDPNEPDTRRIPDKSGIAQ
jgi:hypothetical protein